MKTQSALEQKELELSMKPAEIVKAVQKSEFEKSKIQKEIDQAVKESTRLNKDM